MLMLLSMITDFLVNVEFWTKHLYCEKIAAVLVVSVELV